MPKGNPKNPHDLDEAAVEMAAPIPIMRARVTTASKRDADNDGIHTVRVQVYGDPSPYEASVLTASQGDVNMPSKGDDVAIGFGPSGQPFVLGYWYPADKVDDGRADLPDYQPGDRVIGHSENSSYIRIDKDGDIHINSEGDVFINGVKQ